MGGWLACLLLLACISCDLCAYYASDKVKDGVVSEKDEYEALISRFRDVKRVLQEDGKTKRGKTVKEEIQSNLKTEKKGHLNNAEREELVKLLSERIIGGTDTGAGDWPWLVFIRAEYRTSWWRSTTKVHCGASLINNRWLLTAAHCVSGKYLDNPKNWHAILGTNDRSSSVWVRFKGWWCKKFKAASCYHYRVDVEKIITHSGYRAASTWYNDIALMKLKEEVPAGSDVARVRSVTLPGPYDYNFPPDNAQCIMKGWGCTEHGGDLPKIAKQVTLPKISDSWCKSNYKIDTSTRLCAGYNLKSKGICPGDSGGPLVCKKNGKWVQVGIASFTSANKPGQWPGAFTRVYAYKTWIQQTIQYN